MRRSLESCLDGTTRTCILIYLFTVSSSCWVIRTVFVTHMQRHNILSFWAKKKGMQRQRFASWITWSTNDIALQKADWERKWRIRYYLLPLRNLFPELPRYCIFREWWQGKRSDAKEIHERNPWFLGFGGGYLFLPYLLAAGIPPPSIPIHSWPKLLTSTPIFLPLLPWRNQMMGIGQKERKRPCNLVRGAVDWLQTHQWISRIVVSVFIPYKLFILSRMRKKSKCTTETKADTFIKHFHSPWFLHPPVSSVLSLAFHWIRRQWWSTPMARNLLRLTLLLACRGNS